MGKPPKPPGKIQVGSRMKCINAANFDMTYPEIDVPLLNQIYTIREIISNPDNPSTQCYRFQEIVNPVRAYQNPGRGECAFKASRFQKVK